MSCWFCWNNTGIDRELILHSFENFYLAYAKGPIQDFHFLIIPKEHLQAFPVLSAELKKEMVDILRKLL